MINHLDWSDEQLAEHFLYYFKDHEGRLPGGNWSGWRTSVEPYFVHPHEKRAKEFLADRGCIIVPKDYSQILEMGKEGRAALKFKGGPIAYWEDQKKAQEEVRGANRAKITDTIWNKRFLVINGLFTLITMGLTAYTIGWSRADDANAVREHEARYHPVVKERMNPEGQTMSTDTSATLK